MKKIKAPSVIIAQILVFYMLPPISKSLGAMGTVLFLLICTLILAFIMGGMSRSKIAWLYPVFTALVFIPSVFIYYNESALVQSVWYAAVSLAGFAAGRSSYKDDK